MRWREWQSSGKLLRMKRADALRLIRVREALSSGTAREQRIAARLSLAEVGALCGVDQSTVWRWETGKRTPRGPVALRYARVLETLRQEKAVTG